MSKLTLWNKAGRFLTATVVLCFFLPFFGISCNGMEIITVSGADMVGGCKPGGLIAQEQPGGGGMGELKIDNVEREPLAIAAMAIALVCFGLAWVRSRGALLGACVLAVAALGTLGGLYVAAKADMDEGAKLQVGDKPSEPGAFGDGIAKDLEKDVDIDAGARMGFWLTCLGFIAIATLAGLALLEKAGATAAPPPPPPPGYPPPPPPPALI